MPRDFRQGCIRGASVPKIFGSGEVSVLRFSAWSPSGERVFLRFSAPVRSETKSALRFSAWSPSGERVLLRFSVSLGQVS